jgi:PAS domain S-box-containing protein/putative nucleotidyltransferase with HDIG domain
MDASNVDLAFDDAQVRELFENANDMIYTTDLTGTVTSFNKAGERITGYRRDQVVGTNIARIVAPESLGLVLRMMDPEIAGSYSPTYEVKIVTRDDRRIPLEVRSRLIYRNGRVIGVHAIAREVAPQASGARKRAARLDALNQIISAADAAPDLPGLLEVAIDRTLEALEVTAGGVWVAGRGAVRRLPIEIGAEITQDVHAAGLEPVPHIVEDWHRRPPEDSEVLAARLIGLDVRSSMVVPIMAESRYIGTLVVASNRPRAWPPEEVEFASEVARQIGATAEGLRLFRETQQRAGQMTRLVALSDMLNRPSAVASAAAQIGNAALSLSGAGRAAVHLCMPGGAVIPLWSNGLSAQSGAAQAGAEAALPWVHAVTRAALVRVSLIGGRQVESAGPLLIADVESLPPDDPIRRLARDESFRAVAAWPLTYEGRISAVVSCYYDMPRAWSGPEQEIFQTFTWQAAAALENARLFEAQREKTAELEALYELSSHFRAAGAPEDMYPVVVNHAARLLRADYAVLALLSSDRQTFTRMSSTGVPEENPGSSFPMSGSISGYVLQSGVPYVTDDLARDDLHDPSSSLGEACRTLGPLAIVALRTESDAIGSLTVARTRNGRERPFTPAEVRLLQSIAEMAGTAVHRARLHGDLEQSYIQMVLSLARAVDARDSYTGDHSERLASWASAMARHLGCSDAEIQDIRWAALFHDIGKIGVPDGILSKSGPLTPEERDVMQRHPIIGAGILLPVERMREVARIVRHHHERWDGHGYPDGLAQTAIPLGARILAVVDAYCAIIDVRPYKGARRHTEAIAEIGRCAGTHFDPAIVDTFWAVLGSGAAVPDGPAGDSQA